MSLTAQNVANPEQALAWLAECYLATVSHEGGMSRPQIGELSRQISIADYALEHLKKIDKDLFMERASRVDQAIAAGSTLAWLATKYPEQAALVSRYREKRGNEHRFRSFASDVECRLYLIECTLATVDGYADLSKLPKSRMDRQISIAQEAILHLPKALQDDPPPGSRMRLAIEKGGVEAYVEHRLSRRRPKEITQDDPSP